MRAWELGEVQILRKVQKKGRNLYQLPRRGKPIPQGWESEYLGQRIGRMSGGYEVWQYNEGPVSSYTVFDPDTRRATLTMSGSRYPDNPDSYIVFGLYAAPGNPVRAADFYRYLIIKQGLTIISDRLQSPGGLRVWQELDRRFSQSITVYGFDTKTDEPINISTKDTSDTHVEPDEVDQAAPGMKRELQHRARYIRLVATAR